MQDTDPLAVIAGEAPQFPADEAVSIAAEYYGLDVTVRPLVSERDQNFRLQAADGNKYVLKIANAVEDPQVTDLQIRALVHIAGRIRAENIPVNVPELVPTLDGEASFLLEKNGRQHVARVVTFLEGEPLAATIPSPPLARNAGKCLANLGRALLGFEHPGSHHSLLWDIQQALNLRRLIEFVRDQDVARAVAAALNDFDKYTTPVMPQLRAQVIHSDLNPDNLLVVPDNRDQVAGVIDFGDMLYSPLVADVAIGCSYLRATDGNPLALTSEFIAGYHQVTPLEPVETEILFELIQARLAASITILEWRRSLRGSGDPYLAKLHAGEHSAGRFLLRLREIPRELVLQTFRQVCASVGDQPVRIPE